MCHNLEDTNVETELKQGYSKKHAPRIVFGYGGKSVTRMEIGIADRSFSMKNLQETMTSSRPSFLDVYSPKQMEYMK